MARIGTQTWIKTFNEVYDITDDAVLRFTEVVFGNAQRSQQPLVEFGSVVHTRGFYQTRLIIAWFSEL